MFVFLLSTLCPDTSRQPLRFYYIGSISVSSSKGHLPACSGLTGKCPPGLDHHRSVNPYIQYATTLLANALCSDASVVRATPINRTYSGRQLVAAPRCPGVIAADRKRYYGMDIAPRLPVRSGIMRIWFAVSI